MDEIGEHDKAKESEVNVLTWKKTKMAPYMKIFNDFIKKLEKDRETRGYYDFGYKFKTKSIMIYFDLFRQE